MKVQKRKAQLKLVYSLMLLLIGVFLFLAGRDSVGAKELNVCPQSAIWNWAETVNVHLADLQSLFDSGVSGVTSIDATHIVDGKYLFELTWEDNATIYQFKFWATAGDILGQDRYYTMAATEARQLFNLLSDHANPEQICRF